MLATYASFAVVLGASAATGQAIVLLSGRRRPAAIAPAVGLAALCAVAWGSVRLPGEGTAAIVALGLLSTGALALLFGRVDGLVPALRVGAPVAAGAVLAASLPFIVEGRYGILGTGLNPDMSQHLFAADRLAADGTERLIADGYPLGPHAIVVALGAIGIGPVQAFNGLVLATAAAAALAALSPLGRLGAGWRIAGALVVGFAYLVAAYLVQGAFKETLQALFVLAFAIGLGELATRRAAHPARLAALPLAVLAIGSVYVYSFPGLAWLAGAVGAFAVLEIGLAVRRGGMAAATARLRAAVPVGGIALVVVAVAIAPEAGRMVSFAEFETFDPDGPGLGNLFNRISPLEALGIWPSGDFRIEPGDGDAPAIAFWLGGALGLVAFGFGVVSGFRRRDRAVPAALAAAAVLWLYAWVGGTPYQEAKALALAAPLVALVSLRALLTRGPRWLALLFLCAAGGSSLLVLANGPVGPTGYSPELAELRRKLPSESIVLLPPSTLLDEQHGRDYLVWELRGNRICVVDAGSESGPPQGSIAATLSIGFDDDGAVVPEGELLPVRRDVKGPGPCPFIPEAARADPARDD